MTFDELELEINRLSLSAARLQMRLYAIRAHLVGLLSLTRYERNQRNPDG